MKQIGWLALLIGFLVTGCASTSTETHADRLAFTDTLAAQWRLGPNQDKELQYYVSDEIRLVRSFSGSQQDVANGRLRRAGAQTVEEVVIKPGTPGLLVASGPHWKAISFHQGTYLYFTSNQPRRIVGQPFEQGTDRYFLYLPDWSSRGGTVQLGDSLWTAVDDSVHADLLIERESAFGHRSRAFRQEGRTLKTR